LERRTLVSIVLRSMRGAPINTLNNKIHHINGYRRYTLYPRPEGRGYKVRWIREALSKEQGIIDYGYLVFTASEYEMSESTME